MMNNFPERPSGAPLHTWSKLYDVSLVSTLPLSFLAVYCFICGRRRVAVARYYMICLVLSYFFKWSFFLNKRVRGTHGDYWDKALIFFLGSLGNFRTIPNWWYYIVKSNILSWRLDMSSIILKTWIIFMSLIQYLHYIFCSVKIHHPTKIDEQLLPTMFMTWRNQHTYSGDGNNRRAALWTSMVKMNIKHDKPNSQSPLCKMYNLKTCITC